MSLDSGNVILSIPLRSFRQRGGHSIDIALTYHAKTWAPTFYPSDDSGDIQGKWGLDNGTYDHGNNVSYAGVVLTTNLNYSLNSIPLATAFEPGLDGNNFYFDTLVYTQTTPDSGIRALLPLTQDGTGTWAPTDGSGSDGIIHPDIVGQVLQNGAVIWQDPNGNQITAATADGQTYLASSSNIVATDTIGRSIQVPLLTDVAGNPTTDFSGCSGDRSISYARVVNWPGDGGAENYKFCYVDIVLKTNFGSVADGFAVTENSSTARMLQSVVLPNGRTWTFTYDDRDPGDDGSVNYADLTKITLPTGGTISYTWSNAPVLCNSAYLAENWGGPQSRTLVSRTEDDNDGTPPKTSTYSYVSSLSPQNESILTTTATGPAPYSDKKISSFVNGSANQALDCKYVMTSEATVDGPTGKTLQTITRNYPADYQQVGYAVSDMQNAYVDFTSWLPIRTTVTLDDGTQAKTELQYDAGANFYVPTASVSGITSAYATYHLPFGSVVSQRQFAYGSGASGPLLKETDSTFYWQKDSTYISALRFDVPSSVIVRDGQGNRCSETDYVYDQDGSALVGTSGLFYHTAGTTYARGNLKAITDQIASLSNATTNQCIATSGWTSRSATRTVYDTGEVSTQNDYLQNLAYQVSYDGTGAYPVSSSNALGQTTHYVFSHNTDLLISETDPNNAPTTWNYDGLHRLLSETRPPGGGSTTVSYDDAHNSAIQTVTADPDPALTTTTVVDGLGRIAHRISSDSPLPDTVDTSYDANGRIHSVSNPYRSTSDSTYGLATYSYDALNRRIGELESDGINQLQWSYTGNCMTFTDEANSSWKRCTDALGRLTNVLEPSGIPTSYGYDVLGNLTNVTQSGISGETPRVRSFVYDSLSRLTSSSTPEAGTISYSYDANSNIKTQAAPAPNSAPGSGQTVTTTYSYDALNRLLQKSYSDGVTNTVFYRYDLSSVTFIPSSGGSRFTATLSNPIGRLALTSVAGGSSLTAYSYDSLGRVANQWTSTPSFNTGASPVFSLASSYDLAGNITSLTYPDGRVVTQGFDAGGHLQNVVFDNWNGQHVGYNYASGFTYTAAGAQAEVTYGNGVYIHTPYNNRQQICQFWIYNGQQVLMDRHYAYANSDCGNAPGNNGNITQIGDALNNNRSQGFSYDSLNRLRSFSNGDGSMQQSYSYDSFGNLSQSGTLSSQLGFDSNNRINTRGYGYDTAGNLTSYNNGVSTTTYAYDGSSQIANINNGAVTYTYDGNQQRARKDVGGSWTEYVYFGGQTIAEKNSDGSWSDYIYANGQKVAKVDSAKPIWQVKGTRNNLACGVSGWLDSIPAISAALGTFRFGDTFSYDMRLPVTDSGITAQGGIGIWSNGQGFSFTDAQNNLEWDNTVSDGQWHHHSFAVGSTLAGMPLSNLEIDMQNGTPAGDYELDYANVVFTRADGSVVPVFTGQQAVSMTLWGGGEVSSTPVSTCGGVNITAMTVNMPVDGSVGTNYFIPDHLGSARIELSAGGWPVWRGEYYPFGQEVNAQQTDNHYKFTGKERDTESGLDYFGARYYASSIGRFMSPDWSANQDPVPYAKLDNPQSLNLYSYVGNNPLSKADADGHCWPVCTTWFWQGVEALQRAGIALNRAVGSFLNQGVATLSDPTGRSQAVMAMGMLANSAVPVPEFGGEITVTTSETIVPIETEAAMSTGLIGMPSLQGFSATETSMIQTSISALQGAGYDTSGLSVLIRADMPSGYSAMSLSSSPTGAALGDGAFSSQGMLNHTLEEELLHVNQNLPSQSFGPGDAAAKEAEVNAVRKFPEPQQ